MENVENKVFEIKYPSSGCIFFPLGLLMLGLIFLIILASISELKSQTISYQNTIFYYIPIIMILGCLAYFCFSRCFTRIQVGIYPTHITIDNKKYPWLDVEHITFKLKPHEIQVKFNNKKYALFNLIIILMAIILTIPLLILSIKLISTSPYLTRGNSLGLIFILPAIFGINVFKPLSRDTAIEPKDFETVFNLTKHYADLYHIPIENKIDTKQD